MEKKAEAWRKYNEAAVIQIFLENAPALARAIAEPLAKTEKWSEKAQSSGRGGLGFIPPDAELVVIAGEVMGLKPPFQRPVNTVFQSYALFPHMTVAQNVAVVPDLLGWPQARIQAGVRAPPQAHTWAQIRAGPPQLHPIVPFPFKNGDDMPISLFDSAIT